MENNSPSSPLLVSASAADDFAASLAPGAEVSADVLVAISDRIASTLAAAKAADQYPPDPTLPSPSQVEHRLLHLDRIRQIYPTNHPKLFRLLTEIAVDGITDAVEKNPTPIRSVPAPPPFESQYILQIQQYVREDPDLSTRDAIWCAASNRRIDPAPPTHYSTYYAHLRQIAPRIREWYAGCDPAEVSIVTYLPLDFIRRTLAGRTRRRRGRASVMRIAATACQKFIEANNRWPTVLQLAEAAEISTGSAQRFLRREKERPAVWFPRGTDPRRRPNSTVQRLAEYACKKFIETNGRTPSVRELAEGARISPSSAHRYLKAAKASPRHPGDQHDPSIISAIRSQPTPTSGRQTTIDLIHQICQAHPDITRAQLVEKITDRHFTAVYAALRDQKPHIRAAAIPGDTPEDLARRLSLPVQTVRDALTAGK